MRRRRHRVGITVLLAAGVGLLVAGTWRDNGRTLMARAQADEGDRAAAAATRVNAALERDLAVAGLRLGAAVFMRIFKEEGELELWLEGDDGRYALFRTWPICTWSGTLGPKQREGDRQAPEGFYRVGSAQMNPRSRYHLSFDLGFPNAYDRAHGRTGSFLMVHGACVSIGCYAMGDAAIEQIYTLAAAAHAGGQGAFDVHAFPFRPEAARLDAAKASSWHAFWNELAPAYAAFERSRRPPRIDIEHGRYVVGEGG